MIEVIPELVKQFKEIVRWGECDSGLKFVIWGKMWYNIKSYML